MNKNLNSSGSLPRIVMFIWKFHPLSGGAENQCFRLSSELANRGYSVTVITHRPNGISLQEYLQGFEVRRISVPLLPGKIADSVYRWILGIVPVLTEGTFSQNPPRFLLHRILRYIRGGFVELLPRYTFMVKGLVRLISMRSKFDICHIHEAHWIAATGVLACLFVRKPCLIKQANSKSQGSLYMQPWLLRTICYRANAYIAISRIIATELKTCGIPGERIVLIPNGVELPKAKWTGEDTGSLQVAFVGNLINLSKQQGKGIDILLHAWVNLHKEIPNAVLLIIGDGEAVELKALVRSLGIDSSVSFMGSRKDVNEILLRASLFVLPSRHEGMSNALLEAMALGLPCIATDISGSQDLIVDGENGLLVPPMDPEALGKAMIRLLSDRNFSFRLGARARREIQSRFTIAGVAEAYVKLYSRFVSTPTNTSSSYHENKKVSTILSSSLFIK